MHKYIFSALVLALLLNLLLFPHQITGTRKIDPNCIETTRYFEYTSGEWVDGRSCREEKFEETRHLPAWSGENKYKTKDFAQFIFQAGMTGLFFSGITYTVFKIDEKKH